MVFLEFGWSGNDMGSRVRNHPEYFLLATRARMMGMPCAPVPPMTKILEVVWEDTAVDSNRF